VKSLFKNKWFKFGFWGVLYTLWVIWLSNGWWLIGLVIIFDLNITHKVKWLFWKKDYKEGEKHNVWLEWLDAIIFAVVVVTFINIFFFQSYKIPTSSMENSMMTGDYLFVSKSAYGPKIPQRPLSFPFVQNVMPISGRESYSNLIKNDYRRMAGYTHLKRNDIVVFNWPHGDTVLKKVPQDDYYTHVRFNGRAYTLKTFGPIVVRPIDKKDNYVKRCVAIAGDTLQIKDGKRIVNGVSQKIFSGIQMTYQVRTNGNVINSKILTDLDVNPSEYYFNADFPGYKSIPLTAEGYKKIKELSIVKEIVPNIDTYPADYPDSPLMLFPFTEDYHWTRDNYGPIYIPKKGDEVKLTLKNIALYERIIRVYESNEFEIRENKFYINGKEDSLYCFKQNYYFMMGDNRHNSLDSRYWGFVPEDHIVGKPRVIWFSSDKNKSFPRNIRWNRLFKFM